MPQQQSALATFRRTHSFVSHPKDGPKDGPSHRRLFKRVPTLLETTSAPCLAEEPCDAQPNPSQRFAAHAVGTHSSTMRAGIKRLFEGRTFRILGEARCTRVKDALENAGGKIVGDSSDALVDFVIVRLVR